MVAANKQLIYVFAVLGILHFLNIVGIERQTG